MLAGAALSACLSLGLAQTTPSTSTVSSVTVTPDATTPDSGVLPVGGYLLTGYSEGAAALQPVTGKVPTLLLDGKNLSGNAGCNSYSGTYTTQGGSLKTGGVRGTLMACSGDALTQETRYLQLLTEVRGYAQQGDTLTLTTATGGRLVFRQQAGQGEIVNSTLKTNLNGTWQRTDGPAGEERISFTIKGTAISGFDGCNQFNAHVNFSGEHLRLIGPVNATRMACAPNTPSLYTLLGTGSETDAGAAYQLSGNTLTLTRGAEVWHFQRQ